MRPCFLVRRWRMSLKITQNYAKKFCKFGVKRDGEFTSIEVHSIGCAQNSIEPIRQGMNQYKPGGIVHAIIAADVPDTVVEILPDDNTIWADKGYGNRHSFAFEIAESDYMRYKPNSAEYTITDRNKFLLDIWHGYLTAVEYTAMKCKQFGFNPLEKMPNGLHRVYSHDEGRRLGLSSAHVDPSHIWKHIGKTMDAFRSEVAACMGIEEHPDKTQAYHFIGSEKEKAEKALELIRRCDDSGILWSVTAAQWVLESGYCTTDLAQKANNCFGMKCSLSGNTWKSVWDGVSKYTKVTAEQDKTGHEYHVPADFRKYPSIEDSIKDHSLYLLGAMNGTVRRYLCVEQCANYRSTIQLIKNGGYATDTKYVDKICNIIQRFHLDRYDAECIAKRGKAPAASLPYSVRVKEPINIKAGPKASCSIVGTCHPGVYTIVEEEQATKHVWGKLLSGAGWIRLDQCERA